MTSSDALRSNGVEVTIGTHHIPLQAYFRAAYGFSEGDFPVTDDVAGRSIALPIHAFLTTDEQERVVAACLSSL